MHLTALSTEIFDCVEQGLSGRSSEKVIKKKIVSLLDEYLREAQDESVLVVILNCGEPVKVLANNKGLSGLPVLFAEDGTMASGSESEVELPEDRIAVFNTTIEYMSDAEDYLDALEILNG